MLFHKILFFVFLLISGAGYAQTIQDRDDIPRDIKTTEDVSRHAIHNVLSTAILRLERDTARIDKQLFLQILTDYEDIMDRTNDIYASVSRSIVNSGGFVLSDPFKSKKRSELDQDLTNVTAQANDLLERVQNLRREVSPNVKKFGATEAIAGATLAYLIWTKLATKYNCTKAYRFYKATYWRSLDELRENKLKELPWVTIVGSTACGEQIEKMEKKELKQALEELEKLAQDSKND